ncbi:MAG: NADH-quinone oxidoreductase subunit NuoK [Proteobacteria bacterium]|nr:NADH-quinone oxidoreductase subunit NuoK [Desulfobulbaceae bacterium]MBU4151979.1 NADH-quinone oxidoreductase subunit NuoK [Pseudomonadota bacterium]MDP2105866.1 NADH-quinone oxidoreductase subunit NuoK [Desulfobulbaceae bacterium]
MMLALSSQLNTYLLIGAFLFAAGFYGLVQRRSLIGMLIAGELVLSGASVNLMAFNHFLAPDPTVGQIFTLFIMGIAAAEAAIALSIIIAVYRNYKSIDAPDLHDLQG